MKRSVLCLDVSGLPKDWITPEEAVFSYATGKVSWFLGEIIQTFHGGTNSKTGLRSEIEVHPIIATTGDDVRARNLVGAVPPLGKFNDELFARDRHTCAYCGDIFASRQLSRDHIKPLSRGGRDTWLNVVTACLPCNWGKAAKTLDEAGLSLRFLPYEPNRFEHMILRGRKVLGDAHPHPGVEYLMKNVPRHSRLWMPMAA